MVCRCDDAICSQLWDFGGTAAKILTITSGDVTCRASSFAAVSCAQAGRMSQCCGQAGNIRICDKITVLGLPAFCGPLH